jgi:hypothetical protein
LATTELRQQWLETHAGELGEWVSLGEAMSRRAGALAVAAEARPSLTVLAEIGPQPLDERDRSKWRQAAQQLECFRDRWGQPDDPAGLKPDLEAMDPARHRDLVRAVAATRTVTQDRALSRGPPRRHPRCLNSGGRPARQLRGIRSCPARPNMGELFHDV